MRNDGKPKNLGDLKLEVLNGIVGPPEGWTERDLKLKAEAEAAEAEEIRKAMDERRRLLVSYGVPVKDVERVATFDGMTRTEAVVRVHEHREGILVLSGRPGCGKTTAAAWWLSKPGPTSPYFAVHAPLFIPAYELERLSRYNRADIRRVQRARRLVIDDLGREYADTKGAATSLVCNLIDARYMHALPLVITTNMTKAQFAERYKKRTMTVLEEVGTFVELDEPSLRGKK